MAVYFKFSSWSKENYDTVVLDTTSPYISVGELKQAIIKKKKIDKNNQLILTNAQTNEEYKEDSQLIQKNTSVLVRLIPIINQLPQQPAANTAASKNPRDPYKRGGTADDDFGTAFWEESNPELTQEQAVQQLPAGTEEDKILAIINQAGDIPMASIKGQPLKQAPKKIPAVGYVCFRCNQPGHFIYDCPTNGDPNYNFQRKPVTMYGVPKSFLVQNEGKAFEFKPNEGDFSKLVGSGISSKSSSNSSIPKELTCPICKKLLTNAVMIPCCNETSCDDCIRSQLMEKTNFHCPLCNNNLVPDQLLPNKAVRRSVESYKIGKPIEDIDTTKHTSNIVSPKSPTEVTKSPTTFAVDSTMSASNNKPSEVTRTENVTIIQDQVIPSAATTVDDRSNRKRRSPSPSYPTHDRYPPRDDYIDDFRRRPPPDYRDYEYRDRDRFYRGGEPSRFRPFRSRSRSPKRRYRSRSPPPYFRRSRSRSPRNRDFRRNSRSPRFRRDSRSPRIRRDSRSPRNRRDSRSPRNRRPYDRSRSKSKDRSDIKRRKEDHTTASTSTSSSVSTSDHKDTPKEATNKNDSQVEKQVEKDKKSSSSKDSNSVKEDKKSSTVGNKDSSSTKDTNNSSSSSSTKDTNNSSSSTKDTSTTSSSKKDKDRRSRSRSRDRDRPYRRRYSRSRSRDRDRERRPYSSTVSSSSHTDKDKKDTSAGKTSSSSSGSSKESNKDSSRSSKDSTSSTKDSSKDSAKSSGTSTESKKSN